MNDYIKITREGLYSLVWEKPISTLASEYSLSDVGFSKICKRLNVPIPPRGYWARVRSGQKIKRPPLPKPNKTTPEFHIFRNNKDSILLSAITEIKKHTNTQFHVSFAPDEQHASQSFIDSVIKEASQLITRIKSESHSIKVSSKFRPAATIISETKEALSLATPYDKGLVKPYRKHYFSIRVSPSLSNRSILLLNAIYIYIHKYDGQILPLNDHRSRKSRPTHGIVLFGEEIKFHIEEASHRIEHIPSKEEIRESINSWRSYPKWVYTPSGRLTVKIDFYLANSCGLRKTWTDNKNKKIEDQIPDILIGIIKAASALRIKKYEEEEKRKLQEIQRIENLRIKEQQRKELEAIEEHNRKQVEAQQHLEQISQSWIKSRAISEFIKHIEEISTRRLSSEIPPELRFWIQWAKNYAEKIDPTSELLKEFLSEEREHNS